MNMCVFHIITQDIETIQTDYKGILPHTSSCLGNDLNELIMTLMNSSESRRYTVVYWNVRYSHVYKNTYKENLIKHSE